MMQPKSLPADSSTDVSPGRRSEPRRRLSVVHAGALYRPVPPVELDDDEGLRIRDLKTGEVLPTYLETQRLRERELVARKAAEALARREAAARQTAEKRIAELEQRLQRPSGESLETREEER